MTDTHERFADLVARHQGAVCAVAYSVLRDRAVSEEVAQEAFLIAWQKLPGMSPAPALPGWVCGIARNLARNAARRRKETAMTTTTEPSHASTPLDSLLVREADDHARRALDRLSPAEREVIVLFYRGDHSVGAVATTLGISEAATRKRLVRGRDHLRAELGAVESSLRTTRPGPAFTAACVAALATRGGAASAATRGTVHAPVGAAPLAALAIAAAIGIGLLGSPVKSVLGTTAAASVAAPRPDPVATAGWLSRPIDPAAKTALVARIHAARDARIAATTPAAATASSTGSAGPAETVKVYDFAGSVLNELPPASAPPPAPRAPGPLTKRELRAAIHSVQPLLLECYSAAAPQLARKDGTIETRIRIEGEPGVGTVVTAAELGGDAHLIGDAELAECMTETLLSIELPPLADGGIVDIHYPFVIPAGT